MKWILQYTGTLRQIRIFYWINNLMHFRTLKRNRPIYRALGIKRSVLRSIDSRVLSGYFNLEAPPVCLPGPDIGPASPEVQKILDTWNEDGYIILKQHFNKSRVEAFNDAIRSALDQRKLHYNYTGRKLFNAHEHLPVLQQITHDDKILEILAAIFQREPILFQTISFTKGSEQHAHSDSIHMTTVPLGKLAGVWVALEAINDHNGPLIYYPGSHKLPYIFNQDYGNSSNAFLLDGNANMKYERKVAEVIKAHGLKERVLYAEPGDVLIWHANLLHGGAAIKDPHASRKSIVSHYFAKDVLCFHEISERPAILKS